MTFDPYEFHGGDGREEEEEPPGHSVGHVEVVHTTAKALLVELEGGKREWFPLSQIHPDSEVYSDQKSGNLIITMWLAEEKGLI